MTLTLLFLTSIIVTILSHIYPHIIWSIIAATNLVYLILNWKKLTKDQ